MDVIHRLVTSRRFWLAVIGVGVAVVKTLYPQVSPDLVTQVIALVMVLIAAYTVDDTVNALTER